MGERGGRGGRDDWMREENSCRWWWRSESEGSFGRREGAFTNLGVPLELRLGVPSDVLGMSL